MNTSNVNTLTNTLTIISWNIFADIQDIEYRTKEISKIINVKSPDIVLLQEVLYYSFGIIKDILSDYTSVFKHPYINNTSERIYGEAIFVKKGIKYDNESFIVLPSKEGRTASSIDININNEKLRVSTAHLESGILNKDKRHSQINLINKNLEQISKWIWIGDSNCEESEESEEEGVFVDEYKNIQTWFENRFWKGNRTACYDKVMKSNNIDIESFKIVGDEKIENKWLSDHNGIEVKLILS